MKALLILILAMSSCKFSMDEYKVETNTVIGKFQTVTQHNYIFPDQIEYFAILDNLDTIRVSQMVEIGDTIQYKYFFK